MKKTPFYQMIRHMWRRKSLFTAIKKVCHLSCFVRKEGQTLVGTVPGMFQSALSGVGAMVYKFIAFAPQTFACNNCPFDEGLCLC
jgi:hypothetical protein